MKLSGSFDVDLRLMEQLTGGDPTIKYRDFEGAGGRLRCRVWFSDGMTSSQLVRDGVLQPILSFTGEVPRADVLDWLALAVLQLPEVQRSDDTEALLPALTYGDALLFAQGQPGALIIGCKGFDYRSITEPDAEKVAKGPKEGFVEPLMPNIAMLKRRLRTSKLRIDQVTVGTATRTSCCLLSLDGVTDPALVEDVLEKLRRIEIDGVLSANALTELLEDRPFAFFRRLGTTARPDVATAKLLEGRVVLLTDGSPQALTAPFIFLEYFQSPEDYCVSWVYAVFSRFLRMAAFLIAITLVPIYVALLHFHPGTLPVKMLMDTAVMQQAAPFSFLVEALILLLAFDLLREAGLRAPSSIGQTLSIVGALVLGQSAVEAGVVSPAMVIVVALSGVTGLITTDLKDQVIFLRLFLLFCANAAGLWGLVLGLGAMAGRLSVIRSFGADYLTSMPSVGQGSHEDSLLRVPMRFMRKYGRFWAGGGRK